MRNLLLTISVALISVTLFAQTNENKAKSEFFAAQEAYDYANYKECVNHLNTTENLLGSTNPRILHLKIKAYCNLKYYSKAYETQKIFFEKATDSNDPKYNDILKLLAEINKNAANDFVEVGKTYIDKKYYTQAINEFNKALEIDPKNISAHFYLGTAFLNTNEYDKAILSYSKARTLSSSIEDENSRLGWLFYIAYNKGIAYENLGKYDLAIASYGNAIKTTPEKSSTYIMLACIYAKQDNTAQSLEYVEKAKERGFNDFAGIEKKPVMANIINTNEYKNIKNSLFDKRDGQSYRIVTIGKQVWMAENLNYETENSYCYDNNPSNCETYGRLYIWDAAIKSCPDRWHLPNNDEWQILIDYQGGNKIAGGKIKTKGIVLWGSPNKDATNEYGFSALPGGSLTNFGKFVRLGKNSSWWSTSESNIILANYQRIGHQNNNIILGKGSKEEGFSVRCMKD
ncbi:MAG: tetratricopeptide repeat protein [Bacteroidales bacterium]|nr:tetratricopeptide repeat protein [Bacteroidales bacterium]